ncbi:MAG TPA: glycosyltransferase [bacterium]|jgi:glycosyltransferase involved in cell wall biosynthesis|nr:glycosyltransferase [bacterium]
MRAAKPSAFAAKRVFVAGHVSEVYGPVQALRRWLEEGAFSAAFLTHPFPYTRLAASRLETLGQGRLLKSAELGARSRLAPWQFLRNAVSDLVQGWRFGRCDVYIGIGNLNVLPGLLLRALGRCERVGYYVIDHTPGRFPNPVLNAVYRWVDLLACRRADFLWCLSPRITRAKVERGARPEACVDCPVGVALDEVRMPGPKARRRQVLVVMSHLTREKGVQLVLDSFAQVRRRHPKALLEVIGTGPYEEALKLQARELGLGPAVRFLGLMNHAQLFRHLPTCGVALATYTEDEDNIAHFADPTKPKEYLACGLPLVITKVPWTWEKVADPEKPMGVAIRYTREELVAAVDKLLGDGAFYGRCRRNALAWTRTLGWEAIFERAFAGALAAGR